MQGFLFTAFERFAIERWGVGAFEEMWSAVAPRLQTHEPFVGPGTYPDRDLLTWCEHVARHTGTCTDGLLRDLGRVAAPDLIQRYAWRLDGHDLPSLLESLRDTLVEVPTATSRGFRFAEPAPHVVRVEVRSPPGLCALVEGLLEGAALHLGAQVELKKRACTHRGAPACLWDGAWA